MFARATAILMALLLCWQVPAQEFGPADALVEISLYLTKARNALAECALDQAESWNRKALDGIKRFRSRSHTERDTAAALKVQSQAVEEQVRSLRKQLQESIRRIRQLTQEGKLETSRQVLQRVEREAPACVPQLGEATAVLKTRRREADDLAAEGDHLVNVGRPHQAMRVYQRAWSLNHELENYQARMERARAERVPKKHMVVKAVFWTTFLAALGVGAFVAVDKYQRHMERRASVPSVVRQ